MARSGQVRVEVIANATQARHELENFGGSVRGVEKDMRFLHKTLATFGALAVARDLLDMVSAQHDWNIAVEGLAHRLDISGNALSDFNVQMEVLRQKALGNSIAQDELGAGLDAFSDKVVKLRGDLTPTEAVMAVYSRTIDLATFFHAKFGDTLATVVNTMDAFHVPASKTPDLIDALTVASREGHISLDELGKGVTEVADSIGRAGGSYQDAIALIAQYGEKAAGAIKAAADLKAAAADPGMKEHVGALQVLSQLQLAPDASVPQIFDALSKSVASTAGSAERLAAISGGVFSASDIQNIAQYEGHLREVDRLLDDIATKKGAASTLPPAPSQNQGDSWMRNFQQNLNDTPPAIVGGPVIPFLETLYEQKGNTIGAFVNGVENVGSAIGGGAERIGQRLLENPFSFFAEGGIVDRPTLGMVGEAGPEAIIPLSKMAQYLRGQNSIPTLASGGGNGAGGDQHFHGDIHVALPGVRKASQFRAEFSDEFNAQYRSLGPRKGR